MAKASASLGRHYSIQYNPWVGIIQYNTILYSGRYQQNKRANREVALTLYENEYPQTKTQKSKI